MFCEKYWKFPEGSINLRMKHYAESGLSEENKRMYDFWIDKKVPYCCRKNVPAEFQHKDQFYEEDIFNHKTCKC